SQAHHGMPATTATGAAEQVILVGIDACHVRQDLIELGLEYRIDLGQPSAGEKLPLGSMKSVGVVVMLAEVRHIVARQVENAGDRCPMAVAILALLRPVPEGLFVEDHAASSSSKSNSVGMVASRSAACR